MTEPPLLETELVPLHALHEHPENWNRGDDEAVADLLDRFGQWRPAVVQTSTGRVLIGNTMLRAAHRLGWSHLNVHYRDVDDDGARRILTADNRAHDLATTDERALVALLAKLDGDLSGTLFDTDDYDDLLAALQEADTSVPEMGAPYSSSGAYGPGGDAEGTNVHQSPSYAEYGDGYATRASRFLALIYPLAQYAWVVERLARIAAEEGCDNHSDALLRLIQNRTGETAPPADAPDPTPAALAAAEAPPAEVPAAT